METPHNIKRKILVSAYACQPHGSLPWAGPGEMILGWNIVNQISKHNEAFVITHSDNRSDIQKELDNNPVENLHFYYISLSEKLRFLLGFEGGIHLYAYLWQIKAYFLAKRLHKEIHFDLFHQATFGNDWMASYMGAFLPLAYVRGPCGGAHKTPKSFFTEYSFIDRFWQKIRGVFQYVLRLDPVFLISQKRARAILVCNRESFERIPDKYKKKAQLFPVNGLSKEDLIILDKKANTPSKDFIVLSAGKLFSIKGFPLVIKSFKVFSDAVPSAKLCIVGSGPELDRLKKLSSDLNITDKVIFKGWYPREKLLEEMAQCDVFLFLSLRDGGGQVIIEAMAARKPVVCFDLGGPGFNVDETCGIKIMPENPKQAVSDTAEALERLYKDKDLCMKLGNGGRDKVEKGYTWDKLGIRLAEIYNSIL